MNNVWSFPRDTEHSDHPTRKPVALCERAVKTSCPEGGLVVDFFMGSGPTLIACEKTNRKCYGMEIDPHYCDVIVKRWCDYTGNYNVKINGKECDWNELARID